MGGAPHKPLYVRRSYASQTRGWFLSAGSTTGARSLIDRWQQPGGWAGPQECWEELCPLEQAELLTVVELAARLKCKSGFIYRRLKPSHPQYIPHTRLTPTDIRFDGRLIADLLSRTQDANLGMGSAVLEGGKLTRSRHRDRKGSLLKRGTGRKFWLSQWPEGNKRRSLKLG